MTVSASNPLQHMPEADLDNVRLDTNTLHVRRHRPAGIVDNPRCHIAMPSLGQLSIQPRLCLTEPGHRFCSTIAREQKRAGLPSGQFPDDRPRLATERDDLRLAGFVL